MLRCYLLDLKADEALIAEYEAWHCSVWPEVEAHLRNHGVLRLELYRLGTRLCMVMDVDADLHNVERMAAAAEADARLQAWEALMWRFQAPTPWTPAGAKWVEASAIYSFTAG